MFALKLDRVLVLPVVRDAQEGSLKLTQSSLRIASGKAYYTRRGQHEDNVAGCLGLGKSCQVGLGLARDLISSLALARYSRREAGTLSQILPHLSEC